ncbi:MAG: alpha/beta fold hydrolase, partial [Myxococcota bacterium]
DAHRTTRDFLGSPAAHPLVVATLALGMQRISPVVFAVAALALTLCGVSVWQLRDADAGVGVERLNIGPTPVTVFRSEVDRTDTARPVVVVSHGFAGSQQLMQAFAVTLAKNGYIAVTFDYLGHGRNLQPLTGNVTEVEGATRKLVEQTREVVDHAVSLPGAGGGLAVLGHSMASDIIARCAQNDARVDATVAVSMFSPAVDKESPANLLIIVGGLEGFLREEALRVLGMVTENPREGVTVGDFAEGSARRVAIAEGVEHVGVLYSRASMKETVAWLDEAFGRSSRGYADSRGIAIVLLIVGAALLVWPLSKLLPTVSRPQLGASLTWSQLLPAGVIPAVITPFALWAFPADFLGVLVGGYLAVHFLVYGLVGTACLWWLGKLGAPRGPSRSDHAKLAFATLVSTAYAAGVISLIMDTYVTSFAITSSRLPLVGVMFAGTLSYFLADEWLTHGAETVRGGHLFTRLCFLVSLGIAVALSFEELFFLLIIAAVIVIYFLVYGFFSKWIYARTGHPAVGAIANAVAFAWALTAVFPFIAR